LHYVKGKEKYLYSAIYTHSLRFVPHCATVTVHHPAPMWRFVILAPFMNDMTYLLTYLLKALRHGSHRCNCKLHHACLSFVSVNQIAPPLT